MTLVAVNVAPDRVQVVTDSLWYTRGGRHVAPKPPGEKVACSPGGVLVTGTGAMPVGGHWDDLDGAFAAADGFDDFVSLCTDQLPDLWGKQADLFGEARAEGVILVAGYSQRAHRFAACGFSYTSGHQPIRLDRGCYFAPNPDLSGTLEALDGRPGPQIVTELSDSLARIVPAPVTVGDWTSLVQQARTSRSDAFVLTGAKTFIGGEVTLTEMTADGVDLKVIHQFPEMTEGVESPSFREMVAGTLHPAAQLSACWCGSGRLLARCHTIGQQGEPCLCNSGRLFGDCCEIDPDSPEAVRYLDEHPKLRIPHIPTHWTFQPMRDALLAEQQPARDAGKVGRNDPCPCGSDRKHKKCCAAPAAARA